MRKFLLWLLGSIMLIVCGGALYVVIDWLLTQLLGY